MKQNDNSNIENDNIIIGIDTAIEDNDITVYSYISDVDGKLFMTRHDPYINDNKD